MANFTFNPSAMPKGITFHRQTPNEKLRDAIIDGHTVFDKLFPKSDKSEGPRGFSFHQPTWDDIMKDMMFKSAPEGSDLHRFGDQQQQLKQVRFS